MVFVPAHWAFPRGAHHQLLQAVLAQDRATALAAARAWLSANDIDSATFREHRLLASMAQRFGHELAEHPAFPRLTGLSRHLWARAQMARQATLPAIASLAGRMPVMLLKGTARAALDPAASRGRISHDVDVLVPAGRLGEAIDLLAGAGWEPDQTASTQRLRAQAGWLRAVNLYHGRVGDIDLHQRAYRGVHQSAEDDQALWQRALAVRFHGLDLWVPAAADRAAMAIMHGAPEGHAHSDWLVDLALALQASDFDSAQFERTLALRRMEVMAEPCLAYLRAVGAPALAPAMLARIAERARRRPLARLAALAEATPVYQRGPGARLVRLVLRPQRRQLTHDAVLAGAPGSARVRGRRLRTLAPGQVAGTTHQTLGVHPGPVLRLILQVDFGGLRRRAEFELNTAQAHVARLSFRNLRKAPHTAELQFEVAVPEAARAQTLELSARSVGALRPCEDEATRRLRAPLPFAVVSCGAQASG